MRVIGLKHLPLFDVPLWFLFVMGPLAQGFHLRREYVPGGLQRADKTYEVIFPRQFVPPPATGDGHDFHLSI